MWAVAAITVATFYQVHSCDLFCSCNLIWNRRTDRQPDEWQCTSTATSSNVQKDIRYTDRVQKAWHVFLWLQPRWEQYTSRWQCRQDGPKRSPNSQTRWWSSVGPSQMIDGPRSWSTWPVGVASRTRGKGAALIGQRWRTLQTANQQSVEPLTTPRDHSSRHLVT